MVSPGLAETNVGKANGSPGEESSKTGKSQKPGEDLSTAGGKRDEGDETEQDANNDGGERTAGTINVGEDHGSITLLGQGNQGTGTTVNTGDTNGQNGDENDNVHE